MAEGIDNPTDGVASSRGSSESTCPSPCGRATWPSSAPRAKYFGWRNSATPITHAIRWTVRRHPAGFAEDIKAIKGLIEKAGGADELQELVGSLFGLVQQIRPGWTGRLYRSVRLRGSRPQIDILLC